LNKEATIIPEGIKPFKSKYGLYVFMVCLFFSTLLWLVIKFSKEYEIREEVYLTFVNVPEGKLIVQADTIINYTIKANGFRLITEKIGKPHRLTIDVSAYPIHQASSQRQSVRIKSSNLTQKILELYHYDYPLTELAPVEAHILMEAAFSKKIPVKKQFSFRTEQPYLIYGAVEMAPDSVMVYGSRQIIGMINEALTIDTALGTLTESISTNISLLQPQMRGAYYSHNQIALNIPVEKFTEKELTLPIGPVVLSDGRRLKMFPENTQLTILTALKDYNDMQPSLFEISVDTTHIKSSNTLPVSVINFPQRVFIQKLNPERVEFIVVE